MSNGSGDAVCSRPKATSWIVPRSVGLAGAMELDAEAMIKMKDSISTKGFAAYKGKITHGAKDEHAQLFSNIMRIDEGPSPMFMRLKKINQTA